MQALFHHIVTLLQKGWKSSFNFFEPKELSTLGLVSALTTVRATKIIFTYFSWWLLLWGLWIDLYVDGTTLFGRFTEYVTPLWYSIGMGARWYIATIMAIMFVIVLSVRASLEVKNAQYYLTYVPYGLFFGVYFLVIPHVFAMPLFLLASFFFLDGVNSPRNALYSAVNGVILYAYSFPFIVCMGAVHGLLYNIYAWAWSIAFIDEYHAVAYVLKYAGSVVLYTFFAAMVHSLYVRVVKGQSKNKLFWRVRHVAKG